MARACRDDLPDGQNEIFFRQGLDRWNQIERPEQIKFFAQASEVGRLARYTKNIARPAAQFDRRPFRKLLRQIFVEERGQLSEMLLRFRRVGVARILRMRLPFEHVEIRDDAGLTQLAMHAHRI